MSAQDRFQPVKSIGLNGEESWVVLDLSRDKTQGSSVIARCYTLTDAGFLLNVLNGWNYERVLMDAASDDGALAKDGGK